MDFGTLINVAQKNETKKQIIPCYQTKFAPPKKQTKQSKILSDNIKKFLARKEEEEKQKALEEKRKKENLLALRDSKAQSRISKHLKVCKAANKSVIADAIDSENTAITIAGPSQPDEDDYGYVSQEASTFYNQLMNKYNSLPPEKPIFNNNEKRTIKDIASTKDRVKQALKQQELGENSGHRRKRKSSASNVKIEIDEKVEIDEKMKKNIPDKIKKEDKDEKSKLKRKSIPSPMGFAELLKLAEKKQHEPVVIEVKPKVEEERPMTKRQKMEFIQERERKEQRGKKDLEMDKKINMSILNKPIKTQLNKTLKTNEKSPILNSILNKNSSKTVTTVLKRINDKSNEKHNVEKYNSSKTLSKNKLLEERKKLEAERRQLEEMRRAIEEEKRKLAQSKNKQEDIKSHFSNKEMAKFKGNSIDHKQISKDIKPQQFSFLDLKSHSSNRLKQIQSPDKSIKSKEIIKKPLTSNKRRIYDEDEDSDLDDFIDDGLDDNEEDYSKHISEIFGYDKSKYKHLDNEDDTAMESNFAQQLKEEYISTKIGIMEDLEDMRMEALEKKKKDLIKKKLRK